MFDALSPLFAIGVIAFLGILMARSFSDKRKTGYGGYAAGDGGASASGGWFGWFDGYNARDGGSSSDGGSFGDGGGGGGD
jgi:hypothetical protein